MEFQLGGWLDDFTAIGWRYSPSEDRLYQKKESNWEVKYPVLERRGWSSVEAQPDQNFPPGLACRLTQGNNSKTWATSTVSMDDDGEYLADTIRDSSTISVSDWSYKDSCSAAACILEGPVSNLHSIIATATTTGAPKIQDAY
eukprot:7287656-Ditylum_brightwellii.AAC.1